MAHDSLTADAFALSPISARASQPSEADYDAIRDAFMETARGRWFLTEYAKRNRNADTSMVLDAVARIEASVAARGAAPPSPAALIAMIRPLIAEARASSNAAMTRPDGTETIAAGQRAARIIREISWSLRETGTDPRVCNIFDTQLLAIDKVNDLASSPTPRELVGEAFDDLILKLEEIGSGVRTAQRETAAPKADPVEVVGANLDVADAVDSGVTTPPVTAAGSPDALAVAPEPIESAPTADEIAADDAVLDLIALEMAAPEIDDADDFDHDERAIAELQSLAESALQQGPAMPAPAVSAAVAAAPDSLGASLIADGVVRMPRAAREALAPFRRMSQIETIAFFS